MHLFFWNAYLSKGCCLCTNIFWTEMMGIKTKLTAEKFFAVRKRLLQMHFDSGVGHIGKSVVARRHADCLS